MAERKAVSEKKKALPGIKPRPGPDPAPDMKGHPDKAEGVKLILAVVKPGALKGADKASKAGTKAKAMPKASPKANPFTPAAKSRTGSKTR